MSCSCGAETPFDSCCGPFLAGTAIPRTAEQLMRSRYSAFATGNVDYIFQTHIARGRHELDRDATTSWSKNSEWQGLQILATDSGGERDDQGTVEFIARYRLQGQDQIHHELAIFEKVEGRWYFVDGRPPALEPIRREEPKIGRNDPCYCGSGKKLKKCHGPKAG